MRIALLTPTYSYFSGIDRLVEGKAKEYSKQGNKVNIFTFRAEIKPKYATQIILGMPKNPTLERLYRLFFFLDKSKIKKYVKMLIEYDIIISYLYPMNILASKAKQKNPKIKYIFHNAGVGITKEYLLLERLYLRFFNYLTNKSIKNADEIISISDYLRKELLKETGLGSKVEYIQVDKEKYHKGIDGSQIREKYQIGKNDYMLLYVGRISPHKGVHLLIEAFKIVQKKIQNTKLIMVGKHTFTGYSKELRKIANNDIVFAGFVPDGQMPYYYAACDAYVTATLWEGFNIPIVAANQCGKKVVAFNLCSHPEVVKNGILVKPYDTEGFANAVMRILEEKQDETI